MKTRDRMFLMIVGALAILVAAWMLVVSPERKKAADLGNQVSTARQTLAAAQSKAAAARGAEAQYPAAYATVVSLGKAVPPGDEVASLVYQVAQASDSKSVDFSSITTGTSAGTGGAAPPAQPAGATVGSAGFQALPFTFHFNGSFFSLYHLLNRLNGFTLQTNNGTVQVSGRLFSIDGASLDLSGTSGAGGSSGGSGQELGGTVTATAYVLPADQGLTGGATPAGPASAPAAQPVSGSSGAPTPAPAVARVTP